MASSLSVDIPTASAISSSYFESSGPTLCHNLFTQKGNNPENQNLAVWFCVRPGPTPFLAFGTPARFRVTGAASCGHYAAGAAGKKKLSPTTTNLVCDSREFATRSSPSTGYGRPPSLRAAVHCLRHYRVLTNSTDVSAVRPAAQVHTAPVHGVRRPQPCSA